MESVDVMVEPKTAPTTLVEPCKYDSDCITAELNIDVYPLGDSIDASV
jgi:hypothetical protein